MMGLGTHGALHELGAALRFPYHWASARTQRQFAARDTSPIDVAMISNYRDEDDVRRMGYWSLGDTPPFLRLLQFNWKSRVRGCLTMIGSITAQVAGEEASPTSIERASKQFAAATEDAVARGARVVLFAAATKRLPIIDTLRHRYPQVVFTLGDNFTGLLLNEGIADIIARTGLGLGPNTRACVIAPYGFLGGVALTYLVEQGLETVGLGSKRRTGQLEVLHDQCGVRVCNAFEDVGSVDVVVACNSSRGLRLTAERIALLRRPGRRLIVVDPGEPAALEPHEFARCRGEVLRIDAGNSHHPHLDYLPASFYRSVRMAPGLTWGCFAESFILAEHPELWGLNWCEISPVTMAAMRPFLGSARGGFDLPAPLNFMQPVSDFRLSGGAPGNGGLDIYAEEASKEAVPWMS